MSVTGQQQTLVLDVRVVGERDEDQPDGFFRCAARWTSDAGHGQAEIGLGQTTYAFGHRFGYGRADGSVSLDQFLRDAERAPLRFVRVGDHALEEIGRRAGHLCEPLRDQTAVQLSATATVYPPTASRSPTTSSMVSPRKAKMASPKRSSI